MVQAVSNILINKLLKDLNDYLRANPKMKREMKYFNKKKFAKLGMPFIVQWPDKNNIYNFFVADKERVRYGKPRQVKQDFLVNKEGNWIYYSGYSKLRTGIHQSIKTFCIKYGKFPEGEWSAFGCTPKLRLSDHWYDDENDPKLQDPTQKFKKEFISRVLLKLRKKLKT